MSGFRLVAMAFAASRQRVSDMALVVGGDVVQKRRGVGPPPMIKVRDTIFVSYSHARDGRAWCERICDFLKFYAEERGLEIWADPYIEAGGRWEREIGDRIERTAVAVLLVSQEFLLSEFIRDHELAPLFAAGDEVTICPVLVSAATTGGGPPHVNQLLARQWVRGPDKGQALAALTEEPRQAALVDIADRIREVMPKVFKVAPAVRRADLGEATTVATADADAGEVWGAEPIPDDYVPSPDTVASLRTRLLSGESKGVGIAGRAVGLQGMGGIGKTALARELIWDDELRRAFPDGLYWMTFGQTPNVIALQTSLLERLTGKRPALATVEEGKRALNEELREKRALLLLDDVWKPEHAQPFAALGEGGRYVITSRDEGVVRALHARLEPVGVFKPAKARAVLARVSEQAPESLPLAADEVAKECGYLAIALVAAGSLARDHSPWEAILAGLRDGRRIFREHPYSDVFRSLGLSVDALEAAERDRYLELAVFPEDVRIPEETIARLWAHTGGLEAFETSFLLGRLKSRGLLMLDVGEASDEPGRGGSARRVSLHDLQHDYVRAAVSDLAQLHEKLIEAHRRPNDSGGALTPKSLIFAPTEPYMWTSLTHHLARAERHELLREVLLSYAWLQEKLNVAGVNALAADFGRAPRDPAIRLLHDALDLSAHVLAERPDELASQLVGRLVGTASEPIARLIEAATVEARRPWLRPVRGSLMPPGAALRRSFAGHSDWVNAAAVLPDGRFVSASYDNTLRLWDAEQSEAVRSFAGHLDRVRAVAVLPDGRFVSASHDRTLRLWDAEQSEPVRRFAGHASGVMAVAVLPDGRFVSASDDHTLKLWDAEQSEAVRTFAGHASTVSALAVLSDGRFVSASDDHTLKLWDVEQRQAVRTFAGHASTVSAVAVLSDGSFVSASSDNTLKLWEADESEAVRTFAGHLRAVNAVAVLSDGRFVSASSDHTLKLWDAEKNEAIRTFAGHSRSIGSALTVLPNGRFVSSDDSTLKLWDADQTEAVRTFAGHSDWVNATVLLPDGRFVSASYDNTLKLWDAEQSEAVRSFAGHSAWVSAVVVVSDWGFVSASSDDTLKLWDVRQSGAVRTFAGHSRAVSAVAVLSNRRFVSASADNTLRLWDAEQSEAVRSFVGHSDWVRAVAVFPDGRFVSASYDNTLRLWDAEQSEAVRSFVGHSDWVRAVAVLPDGRFVSASSDNTLKLWDAQRRTAVRTFAGHSRPVTAVAVLSNGRFISASADDMLKLWDAEHSEAVRTFVGHSDWVRAVAVLSDGCFVSASADNTLKLWDAEKIEAVRTFIGHSSTVSEVAELSDGRFVSASYDNTLKLWEPHNSAPVAGFSSDGACTAVGVANGLVIAGDALGCVHILAIEDAQTQPCTGRTRHFQR